MEEAFIQPAVSYVVACLCAQWCRTCGEYREIFMALAQDFPTVRFIWVDIEEHAELVGDLEIENFPTVLVCEADQIRFFGTLQPYEQHLRRLLNTLFKDSSKRVLGDILLKKGIDFEEIQTLVNALLHLIK